MNLLAPISDIMVTDLITVKTTDSVEDVKRVFETHNIHHLPVLEGDKLAGMISKTDYLFFSKSFGGDMYDDYIEQIRRKNYSAEDIMTEKLASLEPDDRVNVALEVFRTNRFHALPVVSNGKIVGIVTTFDIIDYLAKDKTAEMTYK